MKHRTTKLAEAFYAENPQLAPIKEDIEGALATLVECFAAGGKLLVCGNGGSYADAGHITGELGKGFLLRRPMPPEAKGSFEKQFGREGEALAAALQMGLPCHVLQSGGPLGSAIANDIGAEYVYAQQAYTLARAGDVLLGISTSGNAANVCNAAMAAKVRRATCIALTGQGGGRLALLCDACIQAPAEETFLVQEQHLKIYHYLCAAVESELFEV